MQGFSSKPKGNFPTSFQHKHSLLLQLCRLKMMAKEESTSLPLPGTGHPACSPRTEAYQRGLHFQAASFRGFSWCCITQSLCRQPGTAAAWLPAEPRDLRSSLGRPSPSCTSRLELVSPELVPCARSLRPLQQLLPREGRTC